MSELLGVLVEQLLVRGGVPVEYSRIGEFDGIATSLVYYFKNIGTESLAI